jgi:hypothetical protein
VQITSQVGHNKFGSNFSTNFKKLTLVGLARYPGFLSQLSVKNMFTKTKNIDIKINHVIDYTSTCLLT